MMNRRAFLVLSFVLAACGSDSSTEPSSIVGTWTLQTINGSPLPFVVAQSGSDKEEVLSEVVTLSAGGTFTESSTLRLTVSGTVTTQSFPETGTYTVSGSTLTLRSSDGSTGTATWSGNTLTGSAEGFVFVYKR
jgi:hypothetical protein